MVQKLTANSVVYEIKSSQKHYVLLVTALYIGCDKCDVPIPITLVILQAIQASSFSPHRQRHHIRFTECLSEWSPDWRGHTVAWVILIQKR